MDTSPMLIILVPVLMPLVKMMGLDPVHFGVVMVMSVCLGVITPPVGVSIYIVCGIAGISMEEYSKFLLPFLIALAVSVFIIAYVPMLCLILPKLGRRNGLTADLSLRPPGRNASRARW